MDAQINMVILSHLSDAQIEVGMGSPNSIRTSIIRMNFVKHLVMKYTDVSKRVPIKQLDRDWEEVVNKMKS